MPLHRRVYVVSDLHLGGASGPDGGRGFRLLTRPDVLAAFIRTLTRPGDGIRNELVINGDFVDFLAERREFEPAWLPLRVDPAEALRAFQVLASRPTDSQVFDALADFVAAGQELTVLLGNHDLELSYPDVREALLDRIGPARFVYDNEALRRGDAVIEHGNRYDRYNQVDHDALRRARSLMSRGLDHEAAEQLIAPPGSRLVARVMNPLKERYAFVDLLKPETGSVIPTLLALEPECREELLGVARALAPAARHGLGEGGQPSFAGDISSRAFGFPQQGRQGLDGDALDDLLRDRLGAGGAAAFRELSQVEQGFSGDISYREQVDRVLGLARLLNPLGSKDRDSRLRPLLDALRSLWSDQSFSREVETDPAYLEGAQALVGAGARLVVFGHTHLPKDLMLEGGGRYINTGTWAERIRLPSGVHDPDERRAIEVLRSFLADLAEGRLAGHVSFEPTFARLDLALEDGRLRVAEATLRTWGVDGA